MKANDIVLGVLFAIFGIAVFVATLPYPNTPGRDIGPGLFPKIIGAGFVVCGVLLIIHELRRGERAPWFRLSEDFFDKRALLRFLLVPITLALYVALYRPLGFIVVSAILLAVLFRAFGVTWLKTVVIALVATMATHYLFYKILRVPLAWGLLDPIAW